MYTEFNLPVARNYWKEREKMNMRIDSVIFADSATVPLFILIFAKKKSGDDRCKQQVFKVL